MKNQLEYIEKLSYPDFVALIGQKNTPPGGTATVQKWIRYSNINSKSFLLDLACTTGFSSRIASIATGSTAYGIDVSMAAIKIANLEAQQEAKDKLQYIVNDASHLCFLDDTFTHILAGGTFAFFQNRQRCLNECHRVLKKGGYLCTSNFFYHTSPPLELLEKVKGAIGFPPDPNWSHSFWLQFFESFFSLKKIETLSLAIADPATLERQVHAQIFNQSVTLAKDNDQIKTACFKRLLAIRMTLNEHRKYQKYEVEIWQAK